MIPELGHYALIIALLVAGVQCHPLLTRQAALIQFGLCLVAFLSLLWAFTVSDFTLVLVAENSHSAQPWPWKIAGPWRTYGGFAVFAALLLAAAGCKAAFRNADPLKVRTLAFSSVILIGCTLFILHPFERIYPPPFDGLATPAPPSPSAGVQPLPAFQIDGLAHSDIKGPALINFFASWCVPCEAEHDVLMDLAQTMPVYGINYKDKPAERDKFLSRLGNPYSKIGHDPEGVAANAFGIVGVPATFVIDENNMIHARYEMPLVSENIPAILEQRE